MSNIRYCVENEQERFCYYITDESDELKQISLLEKQKDSINRYYDVYDVYDEDLSTYEKLKLFKKDFTDWTEQIKSLYSIDNYNYFDAKQYHNNSVMVMCFFKKYSTKVMKDLGLERIDRIESSYIERTPNGGRQYLKKKGLYENCHGYDYSSYYANILGNKNIGFEFPTKSGKQTKYTFEELKDLYKKKKLPFGYYDIKITSEHPDILKVFTFSSEHCYDHTSLSFCLRYYNLYKIKFEMTNKEFNAYIYDKKDIIKSSKIFGSWFDTIRDMKTKLPKNRIIKHLSSSIWGHLIQFNRIFLSLDEIMDRDDISRNKDDNCKYLIVKHNNDTSIEVIDKENLYKNGGIARIKSFIASFNRDYLSKMIINEKIYDKIIRIHTDGIVLSESHKFDESSYYPIPESKTTGNLFFVSLNEYYNQCLKCQNFYNCRNYKVCPDCK